MKTKKNQRPTKLDLHIKYRCPKCDIDHWLSLQETKTKGFKVVCDCGQVFGVKRISKVKIIFASDRKKTTKIKEHKDTTLSLEIDNVKKTCVKALCNYGFSETEAKGLVDKAYIIHNTTDAKLLIKNALLLIGETKE